MVDSNRSPSRPWASDSPFSHRIGPSGPALHGGGADNVAEIYNQAGDDYTAYADGDPTQLFAFGGIHAYADRRVWALLETRLAELRASGASSVSFLDAGCGPGTWLRRLVMRARALGFTSITARGFDIAQAQIQRARLLARNLSSLAGVNFTFDVADLTGRLPESDASVDIFLCLYSVLSHLPVASLPDVSAEIARVTSGHFMTTVRSVGSVPTAFIDSIENVRELKRDHDRNRCEIEFCDGRRMAFSFHLLTASELRSNFANDFDIEDLRGLDLFHSRFAPDPRLSPALLPANDQIAGELMRLEEMYATSPEFIDRAAHLLLMARSRRASTAMPSSRDSAKARRRVSIG
jgi:SAM-dependent methyltransferase